MTESRCTMVYRLNIKPWTLITVAAIGIGADKPAVEELNIYKNLVTRCLVCLIMLKGDFSCKLIYSLFSICKG